MDQGEWRLEVTVPAPQVAVATGRLVSEHRDGSSYRAVFEAKGAAEPPSLFTGPFTVMERRGDGPRLRAYLHRDVAALGDRLLDAARNHIARYERVVGPYPHAGFAIVSSPLPVGLGFPGLTCVSTRVLPLPFFAGRSLAHEVLHDWWGNGVRVDYARGNWAEALTTYMADHALAEAEDPAAARRMRLEWLRDFAALPTERDTPLRAFTAKEHDAAQIVGYGKGAFVFHMLRREIGDDAFAAGIRAFWRRHRFDRAGWNDLERAFAEAAGRDLDWFFAQWLERPGAPRLSVADARADGNRVTLTLRQEGRPWRLSVPVAVETQAGVVNRVVSVDGTEASVSFDLPAPPRALAVDPDHHLFRLLHPEETPPIVRDVTLDPATRPVLLADEQAAAELAARLLDQPAAPLSGDAAASHQGPLLIIGTTGRVEAFLAQAGRPPPPAEVAGWARRAPGSAAPPTAAAS